MSNPWQTELILEVSIRETTSESTLKIIGLPEPGTNWKSGFHLKQNCFYLRRLASPYWIQKYPTPSKDSGLLLSKTQGVMGIVLDNIQDGGTSAEKVLSAASPC